MKKPVNPCKQSCPLRMPGCREGCFEYIMYEIKLKYYRDQRDREWRSETDYAEHVERTVNRFNRGRGRK